jgi:hypothetical protein
VTTPPTQLDRIEQAVNRISAQLTTISAKETVIVSQQDEVNADVQQLLADAAVMDQFRTDVEAFIAAHPDLDLTGLTDAVAKVHASAGAQQADEPQVTPPPAS